MQEHTHSMELFVTQNLRMYVTMIQVGFIELKTSTLLRRHSDIVNEKILLLRYFFSSKFRLTAREFGVKSFLYTRSGNNFLSSKKSKSKRRLKWCDVVPF